MFRLNEIVSRNKKNKKLFSLLFFIKSFLKLKIKFVKLKKNVIYPQNNVGYLLIASERARIPL